MTSSPPAKKTVLVADDSAGMRSAVRAVLEAEGFDVVEAANGEEALEIIRQSEHLAMVICDIKMPFKTGLEVLESLRTEGRLATLPMVMLTTESQVALIEHAKQLGAKGWLVKPFNPAHIVAVARKLAR